MISCTLEVISAVFLATFAIISLLFEIPFIAELKWSANPLPDF